MHEWQPYSATRVSDMVLNRFANRDRAFAEIALRDAKAGLLGLP
jgi:hypothetical protein